MRFVHFLCPCSCLLILLIISFIVDLCSPLTYANQSSLSQTHTCFILIINPQPISHHYQDFHHPLPSSHSCLFYFSPHYKLVFLGFRKLITFSLLFFLCNAIITSAWGISYFTRHLPLYNRNTYTIILLGLVRCKFCFLKVFSFNLFNF